MQPVNSGGINAQVFILPGHINPWVAYDGEWKIFISCYSAETEC